MFSSLHRALIIIPIAVPVRVSTIMSPENLPRTQHEPIAAVKDWLDDSYDHVRNGGIKMSSLGDFNL